jgi:DNA modification methylase
MAVRILQGDCRDVLRTLADESVHCCVTSPPYFGLRDYGNAAQIGLEPTPAEFVAQLVEVFREVRRVLRNDGTLWLNLGDSYAGYHGNKNSAMPTSATNGWTNGTNENERTSTANRNGLKSKDLIGIPWRVAFALQADGWYLRQDIIWAKPNPMPESVRDRCTKAHEYVFLLSKSERYFYDLEAMQEPATAEHLAGNKSHKAQTAYEAGDERLRTKAGLTAYCERQRSKRDSFKRDDSKRAEVIPGQTVGTHRADREESAYDTATRNKRSVWTIATKPFSEAHFATMAPELAETCIKAGCPEGGTVLDPFGGAGTTGLVADQLQRHAVLCELNPEYIAIARRRIAGDAPLFADVEVA